MESEEGIKPAAREGTSNVRTAALLEHVVYNMLQENGGCVRDQDHSRETCSFDTLQEDEKLLSRFNV